MVVLVLVMVMVVVVLVVVVVVVVVLVVVLLVLVVVVLVGDGLRFLNGLHIPTVQHIPVTSKNGQQMNYVRFSSARKKASAASASVVGEGQG
ncbi:hypothetical protein B484DRAFT_404483 [Ochromonadaceae sp. CCMP2298]|nr:hypothetical protein B484DRAFT_404483 [Ochromonadaceae sp. CCMP2298]